ncbi:MAG: DinB family protein [Gemmatimonadota bacterium]|nr:MAG: DinB family protein [Gemmatimonadota bacterium]
MAIREALVPELAMEAAATRKLLERVPEEKLDWKPAEKSMTLSRLATHLAELPNWGVEALTTDELDINPPGGEPYKPVELRTVSEILEHFDSSIAKLLEALKSASDEDLMKPWTLKNAGEAIFTQPKVGVLRGMVLNHAVHHRGQLSVFLRLNGVPIPATYGPSADEGM